MTGVPSTSLTPAPAPETTVRPGRLRARESLLLSSLMFGLFFGAGNLIFPLVLGLQAGAQVTPATVGFLITAVGLPILGVIASAASHTSSVHALAARVGPRFALVFTAALYLTIGPFFAIPRTATVSYEMAFGTLLSGPARALVLVAFSAVFFALVFAAAMRPGRVMEFVGRYLTPVFLVLLALLLVVALIRVGDAPRPPAAGAYANGAGGAALTGAFDGYNTMDALASLAFAIVLIDATRRLGITSRERIAAELTRAGVLAAAGMAVIYGSLTIVGAGAGGIVPRDANGAVALAGIASANFGVVGHVLASLIMLAACIKTAIGLSAACVEMFSSMIPGRFSTRTWAIIFTSVSFLLANVGLEAIIAAAVPVLQLLYPLAIVLIVLGLSHRFVSGNRLAHVLPMAAAGVVAVLALLASLPSSVPLVPQAAAAVGSVFPGFADGIGWILPAALALGVGLLVGRARRIVAAKGGKG